MRRRARSFAQVRALGWALGGGARSPRRTSLESDGYMVRKTAPKEERAMRVRRRLSMLGVLAVSAFASGSFAAESYPNQKEADFVARDFKFQTGDVLPEIRLHYTTLGTPQRDGAG